MSNLHGGEYRNYVCPDCGYDLRVQWDHGVDDRCMGCIEKAKEKPKES